MSRLVVVSNRVADPRKVAAGGLAVALGEVLGETGGLWFGWSGRISDGAGDDSGKVQTKRAGTTTLATVASGDYDGDGNSFSRELLADLGVTPGANLELLGATFTWPDV